MDNEELKKEMGDAADQGFNDSELEDIMNEIESLEKEFSDDGSAKSEEESKTPEVSAEAEPEDIEASLAEELKVEEAPSSEMTLEPEVEEMKAEEDLSKEMTLEPEEEEIKAKHSVSQEEPLVEAEEISAQTEPVEETLEVEAEVEEENFAESHSEPTFEEKVEAVEEQKVFAEQVEPVAEVVSISPDEDAPLGRVPMSFSAKGDMDFSMNFPVGNSEVKFTTKEGKLFLSMAGMELFIDEENGCVVSMDSGVKFTIPLTSSTDESKKKAA